MRTLTETRDDAVMLSLEHQIHLDDVLGEHNWFADLSVPTLTFDGDRPITCTRVHLLGTASPTAGSWLWSWANPADYPQQLTGLAVAVRDFGRRHGIAELADAEIPFGALPVPADPMWVSAVFVDAAKAVTGCWTSYVPDAGGGTFAAFLIEHPYFQLPPLSPARFLRVINQALAERPVADHKRALHSYAIRRGLSAQFNADQTELALTGPGVRMSARFDALHRLVGTNGSLSSPEGQQASSTS